jgi:hypothetical protein
MTDFLFYLWRSMLGLLELILGGDMDSLSECFLINLVEYDVKIPDP